MELPPATVSLVPATEEERCSTACLWIDEHDLNEHTILMDLITTMHHALSGPDQILDS
jgi:hypothetical protein